MSVSAKRLKTWIYRLQRVVSRKLKTEKHGGRQPESLILMHVTDQHERITTTTSRQHNNEKRWAAEVAIVLSFQSQELQGRNSGTVVFLLDCAMRLPQLANSFRVLERGLAGGQRGIDSLIDGHIPAITSTYLV